MVDSRLLLWCCWCLVVMAEPLPLKEAPGISLSPLSPISVSTSGDGRTKNPDVVAMLIDLDKIETELQNSDAKKRMYDLNAGDDDVEKETKRLLKDVVAQRELEPLDQSKLDGKLLAISLLRNRDQKKLGQRWNFGNDDDDYDSGDDDEINGDESDEISKVIQVILHKGNGVSVTIQDGKSRNRGH